MTDEIDNEKAPDPHAYPETIKNPETRSTSCTDKPRRDMDPPRTAPRTAPTWYYLVPRDATTKREKTLMDTVKSQKKLIKKQQKRMAAMKVQKRSTPDSLHIYTALPHRPVRTHRSDTP